MTYDEHMYLTYTIMCVRDELIAMKNHWKAEDPATLVDRLEKCITLLRSDHVSRSLLEEKL